jgi:hypothetical protein
MVAATALEIWRRGQLQRQYLPSEFHKIYQLVQKLTGGTDRQDGDLISLHFSFSKESRLEVPSYPTREYRTQGENLGLFIRLILQTRSQNYKNRKS